MAADSSVGRGWEEEECRLLLRIWRPGLRAAILRDKMVDETNEHTNTQAEAAEKLCILFVINKVEQSEREREREGNERKRAAKKRLRTTFALTKESCYTPLHGVEASKRAGDDRGCWVAS